jgi:hypothetical protein
MSYAVAPNTSRELDSFACAHIAGARRFRMTAPVPVTLETALNMRIERPLVSLARQRAMGI